MIRAYDEYGNIIDLFEWERKIRAKYIDDFANVLKENYDYLPQILSQESFGLYIDEYAERLRQVERMNKAFEKIIEKLEELHERYINQYGAVGGNPMAFSVKECMEIVKQEAEKYNVMIDGEYCFQSCGCTEMCGKCSRIANGDTDYYESICAFSEKTNADRIRSFSDEELAEFIEQVSTDSMETISFGTKEYEEIWEHKETALQWLQSEVEVDKLD